MSLPTKRKFVLFSALLLTMNFCTLVGKVAE